MSISISECTLVYSQLKEGGYRTYLRVEQPLPSLSKVDRGQEVARWGEERGSRCFYDLRFTCACIKETRFKQYFHSYSCFFFFFVPLNRR